MYRAVEMGGAKKVLSSRAGDDGVVLSVHGDLSNLKQSLDALREYCRTRGVGDRALYDAELVFEEAVTNIARHGYAGAADRIIDVCARAEADHLVLVFEDESKPFDPRSESAAGASSPDEAKIGGLGIALMRRAATRMNYERSGGRNRLTVAIELRAEL